MARLRAQLLEPPKSGATGERGFEVMKSGDARVAMVGFPSVGKSTLLSMMTETESKSAAYEFTTLTCIPGVMTYQGANIQILDMPGIIEGAAYGRGRGRQVVACAKTADMIMLVLDATKDMGQIEILERELHAVGIRLNQKPADITFRIKKSGGVLFNSTVPLTHCTESLVRGILHDYKIHNCDVLFREDATVDQFIDIIGGKAAYIQCLYVWNKIDDVPLEEVDRLARLPNSTCISCNMKLNLDGLRDEIWNYLSMVRVFTKKRGEEPNLDEALILRNGATVEDAAHSIHRNLASQFKYALVWGRSAKHQPQRVGLKHVLQDEDVLFIATSGGAPGG